MLVFIRISCTKKHLKITFMLFALVICQYLQPQNNYFWSNDLQPRFEKAPN